LHLNLSFDGEYNSGEKSLSIEKAVGPGRSGRANVSGRNYNLGPVPTYYRQISRAYIRRFGMIDLVAMKLEIDPGFLKRWVQHERHRHDYIMATRTEAIRIIFVTIE
jgi:hypothetical protein